jgi:predicted DNA-binding transcriptional regulator YafY
MRADRLLSIILLLQKHHHLTAAALAKELAVTERTIYRDLDALNVAGVPVYTRSGPDGGCFLDDAYRTSLHWFSGNELQTLLYTSSASPLVALGMGSAMEQAVLKLLTMLPERGQRQAQAMRQRLYLDPTGWYHQGEQHPHLGVLKEAVWGDFLIEVVYESQDGTVKPRTLAPYSLIYKSDRWYMAAADKSGEIASIRTYRVNRLTALRIRTERFERDLTFDIERYWQDAAAAFRKQMPSYIVLLRAHQNAMPYFASTMSGRYEILEQQDIWTLLRVHYTVFEEARTSALGLGTDVHVIDPPELHAAVIALAEAVVARHAESR